MRTEEIKIYTFEELDKKAKEKAREWYKDTMRDDFFIESDSITDNMENVLYINGYSNTKVYLAEIIFLKDINKKLAKIS